MASIIVLSSVTQKKYTVDVEGNTLRDLKEVLSRNGIQYNGLSFFEGRTKTELLSDDSTFPDNAIFRLTQTEKKITSGSLTRKECIDIIKQNPNIAADIKQHEGKSWTNCSTDVLINYCASNNNDSQETITLDNVKDWVNYGITHKWINEATATMLLSNIIVEDITDEDDEVFDFIND